MKKKSALLLDQTIQAMIVEWVGGAPMAGLEDVSHPFQCPYPQLDEIPSHPPPSGPSQTLRKPNLASRVLVLLKLAGRSTMMLIVGTLANIASKMIAMWGCQMRNRPLLMHGSVTSAYHELLQAGVVDKSCPTTIRTTQHKAYYPPVLTVQESSDEGLPRSICVDTDEQILIPLSRMCFEFLTDHWQEHCYLPVPPLSIQRTKKKTLRFRRKAHLSHVPPIIFHHGLLDINITKTTTRWPSVRLRPNSSFPISRSVTHPTFLRSAAAIPWTLILFWKTSIVPGCSQSAPGR